MPLPGTSTIAPEFGIDNAAAALARANFINIVIVQGGVNANPNVAGSSGSSIELTAFASIGNPAMLVAKLSQTLMHGTLSAPAASIIQNAVGAQGADNPARCRAHSRLSHPVTRPISSGSDK